MNEKCWIDLHFLSACDNAHLWNAASFKIPQYASEDAELLLVGNKLDCETDREITKQQGEKVRAMWGAGERKSEVTVPRCVHLAVDVLLTNDLFF